MHTAQDSELISEACAAEDDPLPAYIKFEPDRYDELLRDKVDAVRRGFDEFFPGGVTDLDVFPSPPTHYRQRCKLGIANADAPGAAGADAGPGVE